MSGKAARVTVTETHHAILDQMAQSRTAPQRLIQRAQMILLAFAGAVNTAIADEVGLDRKRRGQDTKPPQNTTSYWGLRSSAKQLIGGHIMPSASSCLPARGRFATYGGGPGEVGE